MENKINIIRQKRKTIAIHITKEAQVVVKAPFKMSDNKVLEFIQNHEQWIKNGVTVQQNRNENKLSENEIELLKQKAKEIMPQKVEHYSKILNLVPCSVKITSANTRWGSCSGKNSICFTYKIALLPDDLIDYIVVHELCHIKEKNHSARFYALVSQYMPDYKNRIKRLKEIQKQIY